MKYSLAIFDLDGTLVDTAEDLAAALNNALALNGEATYDIPAVRLMVGHGVRNLVSQALAPSKNLSDEYVSRVLADFKAYYAGHYLDYSRPYEGIPQLLAKLSERGVHLAVASNKFQEGTQTIIEGLFPDIHFDCILGNSLSLPLKPSPEVVQYIMSKCPGVTARETVMVGDAETDIQTAANAGVDSIAVTWGFRSVDCLGGATFLAHNHKELDALLLG